MSFRNSMCANEENDDLDKGFAAEEGCEPTLGFTTSQLDYKVGSLTIALKRLPGRWIRVLHLTKPL